MAVAKGKELTNLSFRKFNFNGDAHSYKADLIFGVETFCYADNLNTLCKNLSGCLGHGGRIVIFDGYERLPGTYAPLTLDEEKAYQLVCWGFALTRFQSLQEMYDAAQSNDLTIELEDDLTNGILPNYKVFEQGSLKLVSYPLLAKYLISLKIVSRIVYLHVLSGLFGAYFMERIFFSYYQFVLKKEK
jgi:arsenite methyltransferase